MKRVRIRKKFNYKQRSESALAERHPGLEAKPRKPKKKSKAFSYRYIPYDDPSRVKARLVAQKREARKKALKFFTISIPLNHLPI